MSAQCAEGLIEAMMHIRNNPDLAKRFGRNARARYEQKFTLGMWRHFIHTFMSPHHTVGIVSDQSDYQCPAITLDFVQPLSIDGIVDDRGAAVGFLIQYRRHTRRLRQETEN